MSVRCYPQVRGEVETISKLAQGFSIGRLGDGEVKMMTGGAQCREPRNEALAKELCEFAINPDPMCLVGILTLNPDGPKYANLARHAWRFCKVLSPKVTYYAADITRPDHAPWIENRVYAESVQALWAGKRVAVVCERKGSIYRAVKLSSGPTIHVECPTHEAYAEIDRLQQEVEDFKPDVAVLSAGLTATCLANRLAGRGIQALDMGSAGKFLFRNLT